MTYLQILRLLERYAWNQPDVHSVVREFTDLNRETAQYAAVVIQDRDGERDLISDQDWITYTWHIGYVDRLWEEKMSTSYGEKGERLGNENILTNRDDIYSQGIRVINNIIAGLRRDYDLDITTPDRINTFNQRFTAECAGVYMVIAVTVPVSDCEDSGVESMYDSLDQRFTANGTYHFVPEGKPWNEADIVIDVHPQDPLVTNFTENGTYDLEGEWKDAQIGVFVHPSTSLSETYTENGTYNIDGEFNGGQVTVAVSAEKPEESLVETITSNGSYSYAPQEGYVYDSVSLSVDVHPTRDLRDILTQNNVEYQWPGEWRSVRIAVSVPSDRKPEQSLAETITSNGSYSYVPQEGYVYDSVSLSVDVHPSTSLSASYTENGTYTIADEFNGGTIDVDVHPSTSLSVSYSSNGVYPIQGEFNGGEITVAVSAQKPEESLVETITSNGSYNYTPQAGYVFDSVALSVDVHPSQRLTRTYTTNGSKTLTGEWKDGTITVNVPTYETETVTYMFGQTGSTSKVFYYDSQDGDYAAIISALPSGWRASDMNPHPANDEIYYQSYTGETITPYNDTDFGANLVSNTVQGDWCVLKFDGPVLRTGYNSFYSRNPLKKVVLPDSCTVISQGSFSSTALQEFVMSDNVTVIRGVAFSDCYALHSPFRISRGCTMIGDFYGGSFSECTALTAITIPATVTEIGPGCFADCTHLISVRVNSVVPPTLDLDANQQYSQFANNAPSRKIQVPPESVSTYQTAPGWSDYAADIIAFVN